MGAPKRAKAAALEVLVSYPRFWDLKGSSGLHYYFCRQCWCIHHPRAGLTAACLAGLMAGWLAGCGWREQVERGQRWQRCTAAEATCMHAAAHNPLAWARRGIDQLLLQQSSELFGLPPLPPPARPARRLGQRTAPLQPIVTVSVARSPHLLLHSCAGWPIACGHLCGVAGAELKGCDSRSG